MGSRGPDSSLDQTTHEVRANPENSAGEDLKDGRGKKENFGLAVLKTWRRPYYQR
jgi:hypothetical protein